MVIVWEVARYQSCSDSQHPVSVFLLGSRSMHYRIWDASGQGGEFVNGWSSPVDDSRVANLCICIADIYYATTSICNVSARSKCNGLSQVCCIQNHHSVQACYIWTIAKVEISSHNSQDPARAHFANDSKAATHCVNFWYECFVFCLSFRYYACGLWEKLSSPGYDQGLAEWEGNILNLKIELCALSLRDCRQVRDWVITSHDVRGSCSQLLQDDEGSCPDKYSGRSICVAYSLHGRILLLPVEAISTILIVEALG